MESRNFAIVVLTVVGRKPGTMRIMAISIIRIEEGKVCKQFKSAVNPERDVPDYIMQRTGITAAQLLKSPTFSELAEQVISLLQDVVLVAHNCSFIHYILQSEFRYLDWIYTSPKLSTMQLAKKLIPNLSSYELPYLCRVLGISYGNGYHSEEEAEAISTLFQRLLSLDLEGKIIGNMIRPSFRVPQKLPVHVDSSQIHALPTRPGIYKFQNTNGRVIYVGKAKNIKKRVLSHFYHPSEKERNLCQETYTIDHEVMGSELLAFLREADLIQKHSPDHNFIQKKRHITYYIVPQKNRKGILQLKIERRPFQHTPSEFFFKRRDVIKRLGELCERFQLCPVVTGLQYRSGKCNRWQLEDCNCVCKGKETIGSYNHRVEQALEYLDKESDDFVIFEKGRHNDECSFVLVLHGVYQGYGFLDVTHAISGVHDLLDLLEPKRHTYHTAQIVLKYAVKNPKSLQKLKGERG